MSPEPLLEPPHLREVAALSGGFDSSFRFGSPAQLREGSTEIFFLHKSTGIDGNQFYCK